MEEQCTNEHTHTHKRQANAPLLSAWPAYGRDSERMNDRTMLCVERDRRSALVSEHNTEIAAVPVGVPPWQLRLGDDVTADLHGNRPRLPVTA